MNPKSFLGVSETTQELVLARAEIERLKGEKADFESRALDIIESLEGQLSQCRTRLGECGIRLGGKYDV